jgi:2-oxo-4-hydroxy-4-carboxy--5-ureidoimidazoline (OHCU) decarboxylase
MTRLSTHVLDLTHRRPAAAVSVLPNDLQRDQAGAGLDRLTSRRLTHQPASEIAEAIAQIGLISRLRLFDVVIA